jgi:hypothetical protein
MSELLTDHLQKKWNPILEHADLPKITDPYRRGVTAVLLENTERAINETTNAVGGGMSPVIGDAGSNIQGFDPILISLVRRAMPNMIAYDVAGVQPMTGPTGLIFAMRARFGDQGNEAFYNEPATYSGATNGAITAGAVFDAGYSADPLNELSAFDYKAGFGFATANAETGSPAEMSFSIERVAVEAKTRMLQAKYTVELAQDLKAVHGLDAESELANILSTEILAEINREVIRNLNITAQLGAAQSDLATSGTVDGAVATAGIYDLVADSDGRWSAERFRGLMFQIERECNQIAKSTRRGKGNFIICSSDVASALSMSGVLDHAPAFANLEVDDTGNTFVGTLNGRLKVFVDPYAGINYINVGYRGASQYDAGVFYCPYVPLQMARAVDATTYQPQIAFKTRYGMVANPFSKGTASLATPYKAGATPLEPRANVYYRIFRVDNLHGISAGGSA